MYTYKYVGFSDIDELYFPINKTLIELLNEMDISGRGSFTFSVKYHITQMNTVPEWSTIGLDNVSSIVNHFIPLHYFNTMLKPVALYSSKTVFKPETVFTFIVHNVFEHVKGSVRYDVQYHEGFVRHFKLKSLWGMWIPPTINETYIVDMVTEIGEVLLQNIIANVFGIIKSIHGWNL